MPHVVQMVRVQNHVWLLSRLNKTIHETTILVEKMSSTAYDNSLEIYSGMQNEWQLEDEQKGQRLGKITQLEP